MNNPNKIKQKTRKRLGGSFSSGLSIFLLLFILGLFMIAGYHVYQFSQVVKEDFEIKVNLFAETSEEDALALKQELTACTFVKSVDYISKETAAEIFTKELGKDFVSFLGFNPLYPSLQVKLQAESIQQSNIAALIKQVSSNPNVKDVDYNENVLEQVNSLFYYITIFGLILTGILLVIVVALIGNTVVMWVFDKRFTIRTMELVGARFGFIIKPFLWKALKIGFLSSLFAIISLGVLLYFGEREILSFPKMQEHLNTYIVIAGTILSIGVLLTLTITYFSVKKYIRLKGQQLY